VFVKGKSGNPGGRPRASVEAQAKLRDLALMDVDAAYARLRVNALEEGETAAILKLLTLAGVKVDADAVVKLETPNQAAPSPPLSINDLLKRASTTVTTLS
jgi:hypothetical protein